MPVYYPPLATQTVIAGSGMAPTYIAASETFTVPEFRQALYVLEIEIEAGGSLVVDGFLVEVD